MMGYMTAQQALLAGYTHHGRIFGVPIWLSDVDSDEPRLAAKWAPLDTLIYLLSELFNALPLPSGGFPIVVGPKIKVTR